MAIDLSKNSKMKATPKGPVAQPAGTAEPKLETSADADQLKAAAEDFFDSNTTKPAEEQAPAAAPKEEVPTGIRALDALTEAAKTARGADKERINQKITFLGGISGKHFEDMRGALDGIRTAYTAVQSKLGGLVTRGADESEYDVAGDLHGHVHNLITQAGRHLTAAAAKDETGAGRRDNSAAQLLKVKTGTRVRPEDVATGGRDALDKYAPVDTSTRGPSEAESIDYINSYAKNKFLSKAQDFEAMSPEDHVEHARNILAGITRAVPSLVKQLRLQPKVQLLAKNSGKQLPTPDEAAKTLFPALLSFTTPAQKYIDYAKTRPSAPGEMPDLFGLKTKTVHDAFGLDHHLKRLTALRHSEETQRSIQERFGMIKNVYQSKYGDLLAKRAAGRGHVVAVQDPAIDMSGFPIYDMSAIKAGIEKSLTSESSERSAAIVAASETSVRGPNKYKDSTGQLSSQVSAAMREARLEEQKAQQAFRHTKTAGEIDRLKGLIGTHKFSDKWNAVLNRAHELNNNSAGPNVDNKTHNTLQRQARAHAARVSDSMYRNGIATKEEVREQSPQGDAIPTLREYAGLAKAGEPVRQSESFLRTGKHEAEVDPTMGGLKEADEPMRMVSPYGYGPAEVITSPSASGFHIPSDAEVKGLATTKRASRRAAMQSAVEASSPREDNRYRYDPFFTGTIAPIGGTNTETGGLANVVSRSTGGQQDKYIGDDGLLRPAVEISRDNEKEPEVDEATAEQAGKDYIAAARTDAERKRQETQAQKAREAERSDALFDLAAQNRKGRGKR
jgi:hypothetical protein